jgi:two-component system phosphate regulon response regulator PhoB
MEPSSAGRAADRVLVVEDEPDLQLLITVNLREAGFDVRTAATGADALSILRRERPWVVVLDLMLPDVSGIEVCRQVRADPVVRDVAIIIVTARAEEYDRLLGFEVGADDYLPKPFSVRELVMRVKALARRPFVRAIALEPAPSSVLRAAGIEVERIAHRVTIDGTPTALRPLEYKLLVALMENDGRVLTRADLLRLVWSIDDPNASTRTVDTHVRRLRERLGRYEELVETVQGFGYRFRGS